MRIETIRHERQFALMCDEWDHLLSTSAQDGPFLRHHWLHTWWRHFGTADHLNILTCRKDDGELVGVLPAFLARQGRLARVRAVRFLGDRQVGSTRLTGFARPDLEDEVFGRIASHLRESSHEWDLLDLQYMDPAQPFFDLMAGERGSSVHDDCGICPRIKLPSEWQVYLSGLQPKRRSELKRLMRRAEEQDAEIEHVGDPEQLSDALDDLVRLNQTRLRAKLGQNWSWSEPYRSFTRETLERFMAEGRLRLLFMKVGKSRKAANYMFRYKDTMYGELNGFDDDGASANLLRPLMGAGIRTAIEEGCTSFDLQLGDQPSKFEWGVADLLSLSRIAVYGSSLAGRLRETRDGVVDRTFAHRG